MSLCVVAMAVMVAPAARASVVPEDWVADEFSNDEAAILQLQRQGRTRPFDLAPRVETQDDREGALAASGVPKESTAAGLMQALTDAARASRELPWARQLRFLPDMPEGTRRALYAPSLFDSASPWHFPRFGRCTLAEEVVRLRHRGLEAWLAGAMAALPALAAEAGLEVTLGRFDLFHGHLFLRSNSSGYGLLLHAAEYPALDKEIFPVNLGFCQAASSLAFSAERMRWRNLLVLLPRDLPPTAFALDAESAQVRDLIPAYARAPLQMLSEMALGAPVADMFFLPTLHGRLGWLRRAGALPRLGDPPGSGALQGLR